MSNDVMSGKSMYHPIIPICSLIIIHFMLEGGCYTIPNYLKLYTYTAMGAHGKFVIGKFSFRRYGVFFCCIYYHHRH